MIKERLAVLTVTVIDWKYHFHFITCTLCKTLYFILFCSIVVPTRAQAVVDAANEMLMSLNLCDIRVQLYNTEENGEFEVANLDEADNYAVIGTDRKEVKKEIKK